MTRTICRIVMLSAVLVAAPITVPAAETGPVTTLGNVFVGQAGEFVEVAIPVPSRHLCDQFTQPAGGPRPFRVVLDFCGVKHALPQQNFDNLPNCVVRRLRTSQFSTEPQPVTRIVLDLASSATFSVRKEEARVIVSVADPGRAAFAAWAASGAPPATVASTPKSTSTTSPAVMATTKPVSLPPAPTHVATVKTEPPVASQTASKPASEMKPSGKTTPAQEIGSPKNPTPGAVAVVQPKVASDEAKAVGAPSKPAVSAPSVAMTSVTNPTIIGASGPVSTQTPASEPYELAPPSTTPFVPPSQPLVLAPEFFEGGAAAPSSQSKGVVPAVPAPVPTASGAIDPTQDPQLWATTESPVTQPVATTGATSDTVPRQDALIDKLKAKFFSNRPQPRPYTSTELGAAERLSQLGAGLPGDSVFGPPSPTGPIDREALLERIRQAQQRGVAGGPDALLTLAEAARPDVQYDDLGRRDPFEPLLKGMRSGFVSDELPGVENLRMVGVLRDDRETLALLEDMEGHSYIMKAGDPVQDGRVLAVNEERVLFQVDEFGWMRTVVLQMSARGVDPTRALGLNQPSSETTESPAATPAESKSKE